LESFRHYGTNYRPAEWPIANWTEAYKTQLEEAVDHFIGTVTFDEIKYEM
jgi:hypothetical protein